MQELELPKWLSALTHRNITELFGDPRAELSTEVIRHLAGTAGVGQLNPADRMGTGTQAQYLDPEQIEEVETLKQALDEWWNELPPAAQDGFRNPLPGGRVDRDLREYLDDVDPNHDLVGQSYAGPVMPPTHIRGYVGYLNRS